MDPLYLKDAFNLYFLVDSLFDSGRVDPFSDKSIEKLVILDKQIAEKSWWKGERYYCQAEGANIR